MRVTLLVASLLLLLAVSVRAGVQVPNTFLAEVEVKILNHTSSSPVQSFSGQFASDGKRGRVAIVGNSTAMWAFFPAPPASSTQDGPTQQNPTDQTQASSQDQPTDNSGSPTQSKPEPSKPDTSGSPSDGGSASATDSGGNSKSNSQSGGTGSKSSKSGSKTDTKPKTSQPGKSTKTGKTGTKNTKPSTRSKSGSKSGSKQPTRHSSKTPTRHTPTRHQPTRRPPTRRPPRPPHHRNEIPSVAFAGTGYFERRGDNCKAYQSPPVPLQNKLDFFWWTVDAPVVGKCQNGQLYGRNDTQINGKNAIVKACIGDDTVPLWVESIVPPVSSRIVFNKFSLAEFDEDDSTFQVPSGCN